MVDWERVRRDFPVTKDKTYFISAGMSPMPTPVFNCIIEEYRKLNNAGDIHWDVDIEKFLNFRKRLGALLNTIAPNLTMLQNTSTAMSVAAMSLKNKLGSRFNVVSMMDEFPSTTVPFEYQKIEMRYVEPVKGRYPIANILEKVDSNTAAVLTSFVQYGTGFRQDLTTLGSELKKRNILLIVNATQGFPIFEVDVERSNIAVLSASLHKWGFAGHVGTVFYTSPSFRQEYPAPFAGWLSVKRPADVLVYTKKNEPFELTDTADQYMVGCANLQTLNSSNAAFEYLEGVGYENIRSKIFELTDHLIAGLKKRSINIVTPIEAEKERSAIVAFNLGDRTNDCVPYLESKNIFVSPRNNNIRVSVNIFNTEEEIDRLLTALDKY